jgi:hypothetical protein
MIAVHRHRRADSAMTRAFNGFRHRPAGGDETHAVVAIDMDDRRRKRGDLQIGFGIDELETQPPRIDRDAAHPM